MKELEVRIEILKKLKSQVYLLGFKSFYIAKRASPGQLLHLKVDNKVTILRRPLSIHKIEEDIVYILFRVRGRGTKVLSQYKKGDTLNIIGPLGNGFNHRSSVIGHRSSVLVAGGMGVAPLVFLAEKLKEMQNAKCKMQNIVLLGARTKEEILCESEFKKMGYKVQVATEDSSQGFKGTVITLLKNLLSTINHQPSTNIYACGPHSMLLEISKILEKYPQINCQASFEQFMGCGIGACCGCSIETKSGYKKVCKDGPVFNLREIW